MRVFLLLLLGCGFVRSQQVEFPKPSDEGEATITGEDIRRHVKFLASDELAGRQPGTEGNDRAAEYILEHMRTAGLEPRGTRRGHFEHPFRAANRVVNNLVGVLPGRSLKNQYVVVGAHYDHVGRGAYGSRGRRTGEIHNGADDNASGTTGLLELMQAFAQKPAKRSIIFIAFNAEEMGLLGSKAWVKKPTVQLSRVNAMVNLDMIGRSSQDYLFVGGLNTGKGILKLFEREAKPFRFDLELAGGGTGPSDMDPFYRADKPVLFFFTGEHADYHLPEDDADKINAHGEARIVRLAYRMIRKLADGPRIKFLEDDRAAMPVSSNRAPDHAARMLGLRLKRTGSEDGVVIDRVRRGPAKDAGFQAGDLLMEVDGEKVKSHLDVNRRLAIRRPGSKVKVKIRSGRRIRRGSLVLSR